MESVFELITGNHSEGFNSQQLKRVQIVMNGKRYTISKCTVENKLKINSVAIDDSKSNTLQIFPRTSNEIEIS